MPQAGDVAPHEREVLALRADLQMMALELDRHVAGLAKLQAEYAASRTEAGAALVALGNTQRLVRQYEVQAAEVTGKTQALQTALDEANARAGALQRYVDSLLHSTSWRLTAPVRKIALYLAQKRRAPG